MGPERWLAAALLASAIGAAPSMARAQASSLGDLNQRSESDASRELSRRGYVMTHRAAAQGSSYWTFWWSAARSQCVRVAVNGGRVTQLIDTNAASCGQRPLGGQPAAGHATDDLEHKRADDVSREMSRRGYVLIDEVAAEGTSRWQFWWSAAISRCVSVAVDGGQTTQVITADPRSCGRAAGGGWGSGGAAGAGAGDLVNRDATDAGREMSRRGYLMSRQVAAQGASYWQFWWHAARSSCMRMAVNGGRVTQLIAADAGSCNRRPGSGGAPGGGYGSSNDLMYRDVYGAGREMQRRGYVLMQTESAKGGAYWQYWWSQRRGECTRFAINGGKVTQITPSDARSCRH